MPRASAKPIVKPRSSIQSVRSKTRRRRVSSSPPSERANEHQQDVPPTTVTRPGKLKAPSRSFAKPLVKPANHPKEGKIRRRDQSDEKKSSSDALSVNTSLLQDMVERVAGTETSARAIESMTRRIEADRASLRAELQQQIYARDASNAQMKSSIIEILDSLKSSSVSFPLNSRDLRAEVDECLGAARGIVGQYDALVKLMQEATRELPPPTQIRQKLAAEISEAEQKLRDMKRMTMLDVQEFLSERYDYLK